MGQGYCQRVLIERIMILILFVAQIEFSASNCSSDSDCSHSNQLCCDGLCVLWQKCKGSCKENEDCDSNRNQLCYNHRCLEETLTYPDVSCVVDRDCEKADDRCQDYKCIAKTKTSHAHKPEHLAWLKAVFISGSVALTLLICVVFYCYKKRHTQHYRSSFISMETRFQNVTDDGFHIETSQSHQMLDNGHSDTRDFSGPVHPTS